MLATSTAVSTEHGNELACCVFCLSLPACILSNWLTRVQHLI